MADQLGQLGLGEFSPGQQAFQALGAGFTGTPLANIQRDARQRQLVERLRQQSDNPNVLQGAAAQQLAVTDPKQFQAIAGAIGTTDKARQQSFFQDAKQALDLMKRKQFHLIPGLIQDRLKKLEEVGADTTQTLEFGAKFQKALESGDEDAMAALAGELASIVASGEQMGFLPPEPGREIVKAGEITPEGQVVTRGPEGFRAETIEGLAPKAEGIAAGGKFIGTPSRTTRDGQNFLTGIVQRPDGSFSVEEVPVAGDFVSIIGETGEDLTTRKIKVAGGKEAAKLKQQLKFKPLIEDAVTIAEAKAKAEGEAFTDLKRSKAALPGLLETVAQLRELAPIATSTLLGKAFDFAVKETGFETTKGADARAKFIAIINNQVLPLLKPTFGAAFTEREGEALKATMGDPDASPAQKLEQLQAFIDQKVRDVQAGERELGEAITPAAELTTGAPTVVGRFQVEVE